LGDRNKIEVRIAGKDYTLVGVKSEEYIQKVALYVDKKITEIAKKNNRLSTAMAAVLAALNIGDDYFAVLEEKENLERGLKDIKEQLNQAKSTNMNLGSENKKLNEKCTELQLELAKREAELNEVRNSLRNSIRPRG
jgi:cell division protein ZapA